jgi:hypothetical protein
MYKPEFSLTEPKNNFEKTFAEFTRPEFVPMGGQREYGRGIYNLEFKTYSNAEFYKREQKYEKEMNMVGNKVYSTAESESKNPAWLDNFLQAYSTYILNKMRSQKRNYSARAQSNQQDHSHSEVHQALIDRLMEQPGYQN